MTSLTTAVKACAIVAPIAAASFASATTYSYTWNRGDSTDGVYLSDAAGEIRSVFTSYDDVNQIFTWRTTVANFTTDSISVVVNGGGNPKGIQGELAQFYYDGTNLSVYGYNGEDVNLQSFDSGTSNPFNAPDRIASNTEDDSFIISASKTSVGADRVFEFVIDVSGINAHDPLYGPSANWKGAQFTDTVGIWLRTYDDEQFVRYNSSGYIKDWDYRKGGYFDTDGQPTVPTPATFALAGIGGAFAARRGRRA